MTLADVLAELGAAREAMETQLLRLTPAQLAASADAQSWLGYREHDDHHMHKILERLGQWRQATR
jgi:DNA-binding IclR family transcriptional regulator